MAGKFPALNRNVLILAISIFGLGLGEELWQSYLPKYLGALGAGGLTIGLFSSCKDLLDGLWQYPGGWLSDRYGRRRALMLFTATAMCGYAVYALASGPGLMFAGLALVMAWKAGAFPATFAVIGDALPRDDRVLAFSVQSFLVRLPRVLGAPLGGMLIAGLGMTNGVRTGLGVTLALALVVLLTQQRGYREPAITKHDFQPVPARRIFARMPAALKQLLAAELLVRFGEAIAATFIVLYVTAVLGWSVQAWGWLYALQQTVSMLLYLPSGKLAALTGRRPLIALTFLFFALFPLAVSLATNLPALLLAFVIGGLREAGEPARKALIVDLADPAQRGRVVGLYYTIRNLLIVPAGAIGGWLWTISPRLPLLIACAIGMTGLAVFLSRRENMAHPE